MLCSLFVLFFWQQFDEVIQAVDEGKPVDLSKMPPAPADLPGNYL